MKRRSIVIWFGLAIVILAFGLAACSSDNNSESNVVHVEEGAEETIAAQTAWAREHPSPTPGPSPTPTATSTPYTVPTVAPDVDGDTVITRVGNENITLGQFQKRVRFERWLLLYQLEKLVEKRGPERVLDLTDPQNSSVAAMFVTLADSNSFGVQVQRIMVIDAISLQEAIRRGIEINPVQFDAKVAQYLSLQLGENGVLPPEFDAEYDEFIEQMGIFTGMTEEEFRRIVRARTLYSELEFLISHEPEAIPDVSQPQIGREVQDIMVDDQAQADEIVTRLEDGQALRDIAESLGFTIDDAAQDTRVLRARDPNLPAEVLEEIFSVEYGSVVGPIPTPQGWYVAKVIREVYDVPSPQELDELRKQHFLDWVEGKMDDPDYVEDFENWFDYIPQEPLPRDVSPYFHEENFIMPEEPGDPQDTEESEPDPDVTAES